MQRANHDQLSSLTTAELFAAIGKSLTEVDHEEADHSFYLNSGGEEPGDKAERLEKFGRNWWRRNLPKIRAVVCDERVYQEMGKENNLRQLAIVLSDLLTAAHLGVPVATLSWLIIKIGIKKICPAAN